MNQTPEAWQRVANAFDEAAALSGAPREAYLLKLSQIDPALAKEVVSLLGFHDTADKDFLEDPIGPKIAQALLEKETPSFRDGDAVGDFRILHLLGAGSFAKVYLAHQVSLGRQVALKVSSNVGHEAQTMAHLEHDNIVGVFSQAVDEQAGIRIICMQYVPGCTLEHILETAREEGRALTGERILDLLDRHTTAASVFNPAALKDREALSGLDSVDAVAWLGIRLADALEYAHKKGVLHLDIKPGNILLTPYGRPLLTDFNVSVRAQAEQGDDVQVLGGTLQYMSPEHLQAFQGEGGGFGGIDARSDVYSLGVVLRQMIECVPVDAAEKTALLRVLDRATASDAQTRFGSASDFSRALAGCMEQRAVCASLPKASRLVRICQRYPMWTVGVMIVFAQALASVVNIAYNHTRIVSRLSLDQQRFFQDLCLVWNPTIFALCTLILLRVQWSIHRFSVNPEPVSLQGPRALVRMRRRILNYPLWVSGITALSWGMSYCFFPFMLDHFKGPVGTWVYEHFSISFLLSWLIAQTYSFLFAQYLMVRVIYPRAWQGCTSVRLTAREELKRVRAQMRFFHAMAGGIPLVGALVLIFMEPATHGNTENAVYRLLLVLLIANGMLGFFFALKASDQLSRTLYALTGSEERA